MTKRVFTRFQKPPVVVRYRSASLMTDHLDASPQHGFRPYNDPKIGCILLTEDSRCDKSAVSDTFLRGQDPHTSFVA